MAEDSENDGGQAASGHTGHLRRVSGKRRGGRQAERRTRRQAGRGAVIRRGDGRWAGRLQQTDGSVRWFYGKDQATVEARLDEALKALGAGLPVPDARLTFGGWLREWLGGLQGLKASTVDYYTRYVNVHLLRSAVAAKPLAKLEGRDLAQLYQHMTAAPADGGEGKSPTTARHLHAIVHRALADAVEEGKVARNTADLVPKRARPKAAHQEMRVLAGADHDRFVEAIRGDRLEALFVVAIREGLRRGEILGLRWKDVDLEAGTISVTGSLQGSRAANLAIGEPKTARSRRWERHRRLAPLRQS